MRHPLLATALLALPLSAFAEGFSYTYLDARYAFSDSDASSAQFAGPALAGSLALPEIAGLTRLFIASNGSWVETDKYNEGADRGSFRRIDANLRLGTSYELSSLVDLVASGGAAFTNVDGQGDFDSSKNKFSYAVNGGLRAKVIAGLELGAGYEYTGLRGGDGGFNLGLEYRITENFSAIADGRYVSNADVYTVGGRYNF